MYIKNLAISIVLLLIGVLISGLEGAYQKNYDRHFVIIAPIILPLLGILFSWKSLSHSSAVQKAITLLVAMLNLILIVVIVIAFSFSYWQF